MNIFRLLASVHIFFTIHIMSLETLKSVYHQIACNKNSHFVQLQTECVIARFSVQQSNSSFEFIFEGMNPHSKQLVSYTGQLSPFLHTIHDMPCADMTPHGVVSQNKKLHLCVWQYDTKNMEWVFFTNPSQSLLFVVVNNRTAIEQLETVDRWIDTWEKEKNVTLFRHSNNQTTCNQFTPPRDRNMFLFP